MVSSVSWVRGKCVGKGAFGVVNVAVSKRDNRVFAVKSVDCGRGLSGQVEALENEIGILKRVTSPHVVAYIGDDVTCEGTASFRNLHLEYMPGGTVADLDRADVDERLVRRYAWCLATALRDVHAQGFVHCDVKGRNVLLSGDGEMAKLADFGAAVEIESSPAMLLLPRGSPMWMAPEVVRRERQGPESDVWSLGCTVIEIAIGKPAWEDRGVDTLSRIGYSDELPEFPIQLSELGKDFLEKCLRREPSERWSCDQLLQHPYLLPYYALVESSPRCVLDRVDSELNSESDYNDRDHQEEVFSIFTNIEENSVIKNRISKLATESRVNWETHGWVVVREVESNGEPTTTGTEEEGACTCERDGVGSNKEGVNWEFHNVAETGMVYSDSVGANRGIRKFGGSNTAGGGVGCCCRYGCGWEKLGMHGGGVEVVKGDHVQVYEEELQPIGDIVLGDKVTRSMPHGHAYAAITLFYIGPTIAYGKWIGKSN
ncbi:Mitogen-activated protein kinase kinase kinase 17 [Glycine soja]|uniref:Mitogen-activated protein kinase kinase kinase 17 n=1 Tax=Glycine soja TaxID=3848 RepID=A0A445H8B0_GLYSO|nr:Mitogen-activated protein kinase kinase kinase 17 [Glycine soja]